MHLSLASGKKACFPVIHLNAVVVSLRTLCAQGDFPSMDTSSMEVEAPSVKVKVAVDADAALLRLKKAGSKLRAPNRLRGKKIKSPVKA